ncbi:hypothetical protein [Salinibaculum rarum]|nr:hypothetical protein [Salinibaculum sp. KK48]
MGIPEDAKADIQQEIVQQLETLMNTDNTDTEKLQEFYDVISVEEH